MIAGKSKKYVFLFVFISLSITIGFTQEIKNDSIEQLLENASNNSSRVNLFLELARSTDDNHRNASVIYLKKALEYEDDKYRSAVIIDTLGLFNWQLGNFNTALEYFNEALLIFLELKDSAWLGKIYNNIAVVNYGLGNRNEALENYYKAFEIREAIDDTAGISRVMNNIGKVYQDWSLFDEAIKWHTNALQIAQEINDNELIAYSYLRIGNYFQEIDSFDNALENYFLGKKQLLKEKENNHFNSYLSSFIGSSYRSLNKLDSALYYFVKALDFAIKINNKYFIASSYHNIGLIYFQNNKLDSATHYAKESYHLSVLNDYSELIRDNLSLLSDIEDRKGNIRSSYNYFKQASAINDSIFNTEQIKRFTDLQIKYFTERQEQENILLKKNNEIQKTIIQNHKIISWILFFVGLLILGILLIILRSQIALKKLSFRLEKSEKELIKANADKDKFLTIIGHDLKGPIGSINGMTEELHKNFEAFSTDKLKIIIDALNSSSARVFALLEDLLKWAKMHMGKLNFKFEKINIYDSCMNVVDLFSMKAAEKNITIKNNIEKNTFAYTDENIISTIFRNLFSNSIKFTYSGGEVTLESVTKENKIEISVLDNGTGIDKKDLEKLFDITKKESKEGTANEKGTGLGLVICKDLLEKNNGIIEVFSEPGKGSKFVFTLPRESFNNL